MDVIEEIVARSDVEDVLRCKSVCKSLNSLISTNDFVKAHLKHSYNKDRKSGHLRIRLHWDYKNQRSFIVGSSNGLLCISPDSGKFFINNPSTREVKQLPTLPYTDEEKICCGFGYDSSTDNYKVVVGFNESKKHMRFQVLSLKSNKWKYIGDDENLTYKPICHRRNQRGKLLVYHSDPGFLYDGALHWFMHDRKNKKRVILSFDLSLEKFKEIPQPDDDTKCVCNNRNRLGTFEECLYIFREHYDCSPNYGRYQTWVMKNYNSWQLLPFDYKCKKYPLATWAGRVDCLPDDNWRLWERDIYPDWLHIPNPVFVKSLVSPYAQEKEEGTQEER